MTFDEAEVKFRQLQTRVQRGEPISRAEYEDQVSQLAVQDDRGVLWEINPRTGKWMYFDGAEWIGGIPPGRDQSTVMPLPRPPAPPAPVPPVPTPAPSVSTPPPARPAAPPPTPQPGAGAPPSRAATPSPETVQPYVRVAADKKPAAPVPPGGAPPEAKPQLTRPPRSSPLGRGGREWVPFAIGAVVLLFCAIFVFAGAQVVPGLISPPKTSTPRVALPPPTVPLSPTIVRLPTPIPPTATPAPVLAKVIERTVNVRAGPSTKERIVSTLKKDNLVTLIGISPDRKWYQINVAGRAEPAWVFGETLQITSGDPKTLPTAGSPAPAPPATKPPAPTLTPIGGRP